MACMEHECRTCNRVRFDNNPGGSCPKCGSADVDTWWDEAPEYEPEYDYDPGDYEEWEEVA